MTTKRAWTYALLAAALTVSLATSGLVAGKGKGKPKPPPPEPEPPPVTYALQRFFMPAGYLGGSTTIQELNDVGELVGYYDDGIVPLAEQPFYLDIYSGDTVATNLNDIDFDDGYGIPEEWYIDAALGINNWGEISAALGRPADPSYLRGCVIELRPDLADPLALPRLHLIPEDPAWTHTFARRINDDGVVLGGDTELGIAYVYHLGDANVQMISEPFSVWGAYLTNPVNGGHSLVKARLGDEVLTYDADTGTSSFTDISSLGIGDIRGINDAGSFCGYHDRQGGKNKRHGYYFDGAFYSLEDVKFSNNLNNSGDVVGVSHDYRPILYHPAHGSILLDDAIIAPTPEDQALWDERGYVFVSNVSERNASGFPLVAGTMQVTAYSEGYLFDGYVLFPLLVP